MDTYSIEYNSSPRERYYSDLNTRAEALVEASGLRLLDTYGGSAVTEGWEAPDAADNGFEVDADDAGKVALLCQRIANATGKRVTLAVLKAKTAEACEDCVEEWDNLGFIDPAPDANPAAPVFDIEAEERDAKAREAFHAKTLGDVTPYVAPDEEQIVAQFQQDMEDL